MTTVALYIFLLSIGASFIQRTTGFGFGIFIMTALPFLMPSYGEATTLSGLLAMTTSAFITYRMRHYLQWGKLKLTFLAFFVVSTLCIFWLKRIDDIVLMRVLGVALIVISIYFIFFSNRIHISPTKPYQIGTGVLSGAMGGFFGMQGPPVVLYIIATAKDKNEYMALVQGYFLLGNLMMTAVRGFNGFLTPTVGWDYLYGVGGLLVGNICGNYVFKHIPNRFFRYVVYAYIAISGVIILIESA